MRQWGLVLGRHSTLALTIGHRHQLVAQLRRSLPCGPQRPFPVLTLVVLGSGIHIALAVAQHGVNDSGQLVGPWP